MPNPCCTMYCLQNSDFSSVSFCESIMHTAFCSRCLLYTCFKWFVMPSLRGYGILVLKLVQHLCLLEMTYVTHACGCAWDSTLEVFMAIMTTPCSLINHYHIVSFLYGCVMWWMGCGRYICLISSREGIFSLSLLILDPIQSQWIVSTGWGVKLSTTNIQCQG
jgi:hypothetical protein